MKGKRWLTAALVAAGGLLAGCVVAPSPPGHYPPPAPRVEVIGVAPYPGGVWVDGHWFWTGYQYEWRPGRWSYSYYSAPQYSQPRQGYSYSPPPQSHSRSWGPPTPFERPPILWPDRQGHWKRR